MQVGMAVSSVALSAAIFLSSQQAAHAVTPEQLLYLEASSGRPSCLHCQVVSNAELPCPRCRQRTAEAPGCCNDHVPRHEGCTESEPTTSHLQAWRAVDRAYVDKTFNGQSWFKVSSRP